MNFDIITGTRIYDFTEKYKADKPGEEIEENARVWNVYLDEAESYDADIIQGFRNIIDSLLVFVSNKVILDPSSEFLARLPFSQLLSQLLLFKHLKLFNLTIHK